MPNAAGQIWPHLAHDDERVAKQSKGSVADVMWPQLSREQKQREADRALWERICSHNREVLRQGLHKAVANIERRERRG
jgi:hypothetical protein